MVGGACQHLPCPKTLTQYPHVGVLCLQRTGKSHKDFGFRIQGKRDLGYAVKGSARILDRLREHPCSRFRHPLGFDRQLKHVHASDVRKHGHKDQTSDLPGSTPGTDTPVQGHESGTLFLENFTVDDVSLPRLLIPWGCGSDVRLRWDGGVLSLAAVPAKTSGCSSAWESACFGSRWSGVQIPSSRLLAAGVVAGDVSAQRHCGRGATNHCRQRHVPVAETV